MQKTWVRSLGQEDPLEKGMATHSGILAWRIPWTEEPGRLQSMGSQSSDTTERLHFHFSLSSIGEGNGNPLQCSSLENPRDGGAWWAATYGVMQSRTRMKRLSSSSVYGNPNLPIYPSSHYLLTYMFFFCLFLFLKLAHRLIRNGDRT